jgi:hypothetical protein
MKRNIKDMDLTNKKFGKLKVIEKVPEKNKGYIIWKCQCDCGNISYVRTIPLIDGKIKQCSSCSHKKHEMCDTRIYYIWEGLKGRCLNPKNKDYKSYGKKGIKVCIEWMNFINFYNWAINNEYSDNLQIDRINVNGNYEPSNCRWVTSTIQNNNKNNNVLITIDGITKNAKAWELTSGIKEGTILSRYRKGWTGKDLIGKPYSKYKKNK